MKKLFLISIILASVIGLSGAAWAGQVEGSIQGFQCVTSGKTCPIDKEDPVIAVERLFVLFTDDGNYLFVPNLDRAILARHIAQRVRITGDIDTKYKAIKAQSLEVMKNETWTMVWSLEMERDVMKSLGISGF
jgi:hypothetical protein